MDPEIVPGRTRGVKMGESSGKYYLQVHDTNRRYLQKIRRYDLMMHVSVKIIILIHDPATCVLRSYLLGVPEA